MWCKWAHRKQLLGLCFCGEGASLKWASLDGIMAKMLSALWGNEWISRVRCCKVSVLSTIHSNLYITSEWQREMTLQSRTSDQYTILQIICLHIWQDRCCLQPGYHCSSTQAFQFFLVEWVVSKWIKTMKIKKLHYMVNMIHAFGSGRLQKI